MQKEKDLIRKCLNGKREAQKELYLTHKDRLFALTLRYAESSDEAHDILQDAFIKIFRDLKDYKPIAPLYAWMRTVTVRTALETIRRKKSRPQRGASVDELFDYGCDEDISGQLQAEDLLLMVQRLPDEQRTVFNLHAIEGYSHKEIGEMLGVSEANSKMRLSRARKTLREQLEKTFELK